MSPAAIAMASVYALPETGHKPRHAMQIPQTSTCIAVGKIVGVLHNTHVDQKQAGTASMTVNPQLFQQKAA